MKEFRGNVDRVDEENGGKGLVNRLGRRVLGRGNGVVKVSRPGDALDFDLGHGKIGEVRKRKR